MAYEPGINLENRAYWDKRAPTFAGHCGKSGYVDAFLAKLPLEGDEVILDMGCGSGTFAVPLARKGHAAFACDFSEKMIEQVRLRAEEEGLPITSYVMAWEDDWERFGFTEDCVDVAIASRSILGGPDLRSCMEKLDRVARRRVAITVPEGMAPLYEGSLREALGRPAKPSRALPETLANLSDMGRFGEVSYLSHPRPMRFPTFEEARDELRRMAGSEPFTDTEAAAFETYAAAHFVQREYDGHAVWELDYPITVIWAFVIWATDGSY